MTRYTNHTTDAIRTARTKLLAGLSNDRITGVHRAQMEGYVAEAEAELIRRAVMATEASEAAPAKPVAQTCQRMAAIRIAPASPTANPRPFDGWS